MADVSTRELKANLSRYLRDVEGGARISVTRRGKRIATISPTSDTPSRDQAVSRLLASGKVKWNGKRFEPPSSRVKLAANGPTIAEIVAEGRR